MIAKTLLFLCSLLFASAFAQPLREFRMYDDVRITIDVGRDFDAKKKSIIILYALPAGNTTEHTMGKKMKEGDDWHYDIQHIKAQTVFIRQEIKNRNIVVAYLDNTYKSWVLWKTKHKDYVAEVQHIVDTLFSVVSSRQKVLYLNGHSAGGRFIFSYLDGVNEIPSFIQRISFLDSDYGYDSSYLFKLSGWLKKSRKNVLNVFAYNDSVALLNGKRFVSDTGGTWYRSHRMLADLSEFFLFNKVRDDSLIVYTSGDRRIQFYFKTNPEKLIFHTVQVERNGFIHSVLAGTKRESKRYRYFGERAYNSLIE